MGPPWVLQPPELSMLVLALSMIVIFGMIVTLIAVFAGIWWWYHPHSHL